MVRVWLHHRGGGMAPGPLPYAGGYMDQPAKLMKCFDAMSAADALIRKRKQPPGKQD